VTRRSAETVGDRFRNAARESRVVGTVSGSVILRGLGLIARSLSGRSSFIGRRIERTPATRRFDEVVRIATDSLLYRVASAMLSAFGPDSWAASTVGRVVGRYWSPLDLTLKVRLLGWFVVVAGISRAVAAPYTLLNSPVALVSWGALLAFGGCLFVLSQFIAAAWVSRSHMHGHKVSD
jgi:hypothetical protein